MARPIWTGSITFGLVSIPVEMYMAVHERTVHFHMVTKDGGCRLRRKLVCPDTNKEYDFNQTAKGIEIGPGDYALVDQKEIDRLKPEKGKSMEIVQFINPDAIDPVYFDRVYYLRPGKDAKKVYKLLVAAMAESGKCAVGRFVMRERQNTVLIRTMDDAMVLHTLHYSDEVDPLDQEVAASLEKVKISAGEQKMAGELIKSMTRPLHMEEFRDEYREQLQALVDAKTRGKELPKTSEPAERPMKASVNLMDALRRSLEGSVSKNDHSTGKSGGRTAVSNRARSASRRRRS